METEDKATGPRAGLFISSFDINGDNAGHNCFSTACSGITVWSMSNPGKSSTTLTATLVPSATYIVPPNADSPSGTQTVDTNDTRIPSTPVYHDGLISWGLNTGANNGSQTVPSIFWGQVAPKLNDNGTLNSASLLQGYYLFSGDGAAFFPALMADEEGNLVMVYDFSSSTVNPESAYVTRRVTFPNGSFHDNGFILFAGASGTSGRWGDFEATSYDGPASNHM